MLFMACIPNQKNTIKFDSTVWKIDSLGCTGKRKILVDELIRNKIILGKNTDEVEGILGLPNTKNKNLYRYFIESGPQCSYVNSSGYDSLEVSSIIVEFNSSRITRSVRKIIP